MSTLQTKPISKELIAAIDGYKKYGVLRSHIHFASINWFSIPQDIQDCFSVYYVMKWEAQYLLEQIKDGVITRGDKEYIVVFHAHSPRAKLIKSTKQVYISFREAQPEYNIPAYAVVKTTEQTLSTQSK